MKFIIVGIINTIVGNTMFVFFNVFHMSYWVASFLRFIINILICYLLAYEIAKPLIKWILSDLITTYQDKIAMILGMCLFVVFNYLGQRFFAFIKF